MKGIINMYAIISGIVSGIISFISAIMVWTNSYAWGHNVELDFILAILLTIISGLTFISISLFCFNMRKSANGNKDLKA